MKTIILGSGGVNPSPRATCSCAVCRIAREKGIPEARTGCSFFVEDENLLFDAPEEIRAQLNREGIDRIDHLILTHWHPDHTQGIRILEQINWNFAAGKPYGKPVKVYISKLQMEWFKKYSCGGFLDYYAGRGMIEIIGIENKKNIDLGNLTVKPYLINHTKGFYFLLEQGSKRIVYAPCEYHKFVPDPEIKDIDIFVVQNLFWENKKISPRKNPPVDEDSFEAMLKHADAFGAKKIILTHIEESYQLTHDEINAKMRQYYPGLDIQAGYDRMRLVL